VNALGRIETETIVDLTVSFWKLHGKNKGTQSKIDQGKRKYKLKVFR
jgi:hypothetical protein